AAAGGAPTIASRSWRRVMVGSFGTTTVSLTNDSTVRYRSVIDTVGKSLQLRSSADPADTIRFRYTFVEPNRLVLRAGDRDSLPLAFERLDVSTFLLTSRGFHWINEVPMSR